MFSDKEFETIRLAVMLARDVAFGNTGDKEHESVKGWEALASRIDTERTNAYFERREPECGQCDGTGTTQSASNLEDEECPACNGTGKLSEDDDGDLQDCQEGLTGGNA